MGEQLAKKQLDICEVIASKTLDDQISMGVLGDGRGFVGIRGLAALCGVSHVSIVKQMANWDEGDRTRGVAALLNEEGVTRLTVNVPPSAGVAHAIPEEVCQLFLEFYAYRSKAANKIALRNFRKINHAGFRAFIYSALNYRPEGSAPPLEWRDLIARLDFHAVPPGYFSVFKENADFALAAVKAGLPHNARTVPDLSIGIIWGNAWRDEKFELHFGKRLRHPHNYPENYPQATSNPQAIWVYPDAALPTFRAWLREHYIPNKFPSYVARKQREGVLDAPGATALLGKVNELQLTH